jgi:hypothetical protein
MLVDLISDVHDQPLLHRKATESKLDKPRLIDEQRLDPIRPTPIARRTDACLTL